MINRRCQQRLRPLSGAAAHRRAGGAAGWKYAARITRYAPHQPSYRPRRRGARQRDLIGPARVIGIVAFAGIALLTVLVIVYAADESGNDDQVARGVELAGIDISGMDEEELTAVITDLADDLGNQAVVVITPTQRVETTATDVGLVVDVPNTVRRALDVGRTGALVRRPFSWLASYFEPRSAELVVTGSSAAPALTAIQAQENLPPVEPGVVLDENGVLVAVPGADGDGIDESAVLDGLVEAIGRGEDPLIVEVKRAPISPRFSLEEVSTLADELNASTAEGLEIAVGGIVRTVDGAQVRSWITVDTRTPEPTLGVDVNRVIPDLQALFPDAGSGAELGDIEIIDGTPTRTVVRAGRTCCALDTADRIVASLESGTSPVLLDLLEIELADNPLAAAGIVEVVASFTTAHNPGEPRVTNIHQMADLARGAIIEPGATFSLNDHVGQRTVERGFVPAGVIYDGEFQTDVGGGVSQYATTLFAAAFDAGLDFSEYQSHSIYIDRYPRGKEATVSFPQPDLKLYNDTAHAVMIWSDYTDTTITVDLYSTRNVEVSEGVAFDQPVEQCTLVTTPRTRLFSDGRVIDDSVSALYQPAEGIGCDGLPTNPTPEPTPAEGPETAPTPAEVPQPTEVPPGDPLAPPEPPVVPEDPLAPPEPPVVPEDPLAPPVLPNDPE